MPINRTDIERALAKSSAGSSDFDLNIDVVNRPKPNWDAGVLVPLVEGQNGLNLILTKRAAHLKAHPGQIAFPGGKRDEVDSSIQDTALREAWEETGLPRDTVEVLGELPNHDTVTGFCVTPVVGWVTKDWFVKIDPAEVDELFTVPLDFVLNAANFQIQGRLWQGQMRHYYVVPYGPYYIWGATARMLYGFAQRISL